MKLMQIAVFGGDCLVWDSSSAHLDLQSNDAGGMACAVQPLCMA